MTNTTHEPDDWAGTLDDWKARVHRAELPSGMRILFRFPSLGHMIAAGQLPDDLLEIAIAEWASAGSTVEEMAAAYKDIPSAATPEQTAAADQAARDLGGKLAAVNRELCATAIVAPHVTAADLEAPEFPQEDLEMLAGLINRTIAYDAAGRRVGVEPLDTFRTFAEEHHCPADCQACETTRRTLSTAHT